MIVVVICDKRVLTGWDSEAAANKWLADWMAESHSHWGWVAQSEIVCPKCGVSLAASPVRRRKRKAKAQ